MGGDTVRKKTFDATCANLSTIRLPACSHEEALRQSGCAVVDQLFASEQSDIRIGGGSDLQPKTKKMRNAAYTVDVDGGRQAMPTTSILPPDKVTKIKWKLGGALSEKDQLDVLKYISDNNDRFAYALEDLEQYNGPSMEVPLNDSKYIFRPPHKLGEKEWTFVGEQCAKLHKLGFIRKSDQTKYASATVVVGKKDDKGIYTEFRKCGDYRPLNAETTLDRYQLPLIESIFNDMKGAQLFSKLDLRSGYHQMGLREEDRSKTAFWGARRELWEWCVVPFGLKNAPSYFQRQMDKVLSGLTFARCYIDDIVIWSATFEEHLEHLSAVFARLRSANLKVHPAKCQFAVDSIDFLGHHVSAAGLSPQIEKLAVVRDLSSPTDISSLRSALGLFSYYRKFVSGFSKIASPLNDLLKKGKAWMWGAEQMNAFAELKERLCSAEVLRRPDPELPYILTTDWS